MKRYDIRGDDPFHGVVYVEDTEGEWVKYEDVQKTINSLILTIKELARTEFLIRE